MASLIMTVIGADHPGLVESLAQVVASNGGNWLESRMAHLSGQFAGILMIDVAPEHLKTLIQALKELDDLGLTVIVHQDDTAIESDPFVPLQLDVIGNDRPGIVHEVTRVLADGRVNVEEFSTDCTAAPMSGGRIFRATAKLRLPSDMTKETLQKKLEEIAHDLMIDITLIEQK